VSNVSFGLPAREKLNSTFLAMALSKGLDAAIINPHSAAMNDVVRAFTALSGKDEGFTDYISYAEANPQTGGAVSVGRCEQTKTAESLSAAIISGLSEVATGLCESLLEGREPLNIINEEIIPALDKVGRDFESGKIYLPALLMSAEAASAAFSVIKKRLPKRESEGEPIVLATVKGDVHDIGKNIVKLLLESHGAKVVDLGRDVSPEEIVRAARESGARLVGLSALMTTTVPMMERTILLIHENLPDVKVMVGGAVLTEDFAREIGADYYAKDAMGAVKINAELKKQK
jgi:5-methyltetrahydrofolate--homocysteine methyltransferase